MGGKQDQGADRRRQDRGPVHATRLFRVRPAVQAADRREPQAGTRAAWTRPSAAGSILVPFTVTIPPAERDLELDAKLQSRMARHLGLDDPGLCRMAAAWPCAARSGDRSDAAYMQAQDAVAAWIDEMCERDANAWERSAVLFGSWKTWAERSGEPFGDTKRFRDRLEARGIFHKREPGTGRIGYQGLRLQIEPEGSTWWK